ncbi:Mur ligase family protein [Ktedonosporobacter rubrisoli]|uniref:Lipid II isoglutaminyl synthase (glutamine-hydrolyzing) subunit MurT n=1 Tax=Ktedonosporobacter rubrisoli TaxID=2509675 RepID=A0A4P6K1T1_KTERU|nr:Mur ligase family protein [Ktedonosporobacter rubrisoli]QBD82147.1 Mur ligase family protein [Ktedonosporobacter rubrisoli]
MRKQKTSQSTPQEPQAQQGEQNTGDTQSVARRLSSRRKRAPKRRRSSPLAGLAVIVGRTVGALSRRLHLGGGTSIVGMVAQRVYPDIIKHLASQLEHGSIIITGTNGKTTTSSFITAILRDGGLRVWHNREGSNLMRGIASLLVMHTNPTGKLRYSGRAISVLEIDEATIPQAVRVVQPRVAVFTNLFRDQLDRYGEVDAVIAHWKKALHTLSADTTLILNADDPALASLGKTFEGKVLYYGIDDLSHDLLRQDTATEQHQTIDARVCPQCGSDYVYNARFYSHMGHYECPQCGYARPQPEVSAGHIELESFDRLRIQVTYAQQQQEIVIPLPGLYNIYNALAAITASLALNMDWEPIVSGIEQSKPVFGRGERIQADGRTIRLLLAKNPTGFNEVLRTLFSENVPRHVLFVLNDNTADGHDISWIWDVDFERAAGLTRTLVVTGTRALDLAIRLNYAGISRQDMLIIPPAPLRASREVTGNRGPQHKKRWREKAKMAELVSDQQELRVYGLKSALDRALQQTPEGETLFIVPTYTGLLEVHHELEQRGLAARYWKGNDA